MSLLGRDAVDGHGLSLVERRARLERKAEVIRSRLLRHVDALDARRHQVTDVAHQVTDVAQRAREAAPRLVVAVFAAGALLGVGIGLVGWALRARRGKPLSHRIAGMFAAVPAPERSPVLVVLGGKVLVGVVTAAATELVRRVARGSFTARMQDPVPELQGAPSTSRGEQRSDAKEAVR